jgi:zinc protease
VPSDQPKEIPLKMEQVGSVLRARLDNGLTVLLQENHRAPVVAIQIWVDVGSADETALERGMAHLHEHMLFKGTRKRPVGQIAKDIESAGGEINAWTSFDQTVYHVVLASRYLDLGLDVLSDAVSNSSFDTGELDREK